MILALGLSILFGLVVGIFAARNKRAESVIIPLLDIFQSIPILGFFPIVILGLVALFPGAIGVNLAVIFLIFTSMSWNIAFGVYEAVKSIPHEYAELSEISGASGLSKLKTLYIPASLSRIAYNTQTSWAVGLFYLVSSEIIVLGTGQYTVAGVGADIGSLLGGPDLAAYAYTLVLFVLAVIIWQVIFLREFTSWAEKYKFVEEPRGAKRDPLLKFYSWVNSRSISKLFLFTHGRGVTKFTSTISRFSRGLKYAFLIFIGLFLSLVVAAYYNPATASLPTFPSLASIGGAESSIIVGLAYSFARVWYVYLFVVLVGVPVAIAISLRTRVYEAAAPVIETVASIPAPALLPLILVAASGRGEAVAAVIIFLGMVWYIIYNVIAGIRSLPSEMYELRRVFHLSRYEAWRNIYLPACATAFVTGSITAIGAAWNTLIVAEYFGTPGAIQTQVGAGIGKTIAIAANKGDLLTLALSVISMTALIVAFNLTVWRRVYNYTTKRYTYNR